MPVKFSIDTGPDSPDEAYDAPRAIRENLERLEVDLDFWKNHQDRIDSDEAHVAKALSEIGWDGTVEEGRALIKRVWSLRDDPDDSEETRSARAALRRAWAEIADDVALGYDEDEEGLDSDPRFTNPPEPKSPPPSEMRGYPGQLVQIGDAHAVLERREVAKELYAHAIDEAKTPQAQIEIGYLLASRARVRFPGYWAAAEGEVSPPILLLPDTWSGHAGLPYFEIVYEELLPGPASSDSMEMLRLALEAYGRVFAYCFPADEEGKTASRAGWLGAFVVDGLHALLAAVDGHDMNLVYACLSTLWEYSSDYFAIEDRLRFSETYLKGVEHGRTDKETAEGVDRFIRGKREIDVDVLLQEFHKLPARERIEIEQLFRDRLRPLAWGDCPLSVREHLIAGDVEFRNKQRTKTGDFSEAAFNYARAAEAHLRWVSGLHSVTLGDFGREPHKSQIASRLRPKSPLGALFRHVRVLAPLRNEVDHGHPDYRPVKEGEADKTKDLTLSIVEILLECRMGTRHGD